MSIVSGLVSVSVFTRFLNPTAYGKVAVFMTTASMVTVIVNLCSLQGTMRRVMGVGGDEEAGEDVYEDGVTSNDPQMSLSTGLVLTAVVAGLVFAVAFGLRNQFSNLFFNSTSESNLFLLSVGAGGAAGLMRLARNVLRMQLRPGAYLVVTTTFALGSTAIAIPLLVGGMGITAILIGAISASALSGALAVFFLRTDVRAAVSLTEAREIMRSGTRLHAIDPFVPDASAG